jgi:Zn finger protein HypA/HybF involved in hydrogenase expression
VKKVAELYLVCTKCKRIPEWTKVTEEKNAEGHTIKKYEHTGVCPYCQNGQFEVVEVTSGPRRTVSIRKEGEKDAGDGNHL